MKMEKRLRTFGDLDLLDPASPLATRVRQGQTTSPRAATPMSVAPGMPVPDCEACGGDAGVCPLGGRNWRLCPHAGPSGSEREELWPEAR